jgi:23S rRNA (cytosine1962-C5)-methyltransferase
MERKAASVLLLVYLNVYNLKKQPTKRIRRMSFLYQDSNWLAVNKPSGISTHSAYKGDMGLVEWLLLHHDLRVHICSRLDKETSGVLLFGLNPAAVARAQVIHEQEQAQKTYFFIAGKSSKSSWICSDPLDHKPCKTHFVTIQEGSVYTLYKALIHRGRTHQIRRHAAASGIPILGDTEYKGSEFSRVCLHCSKVDWPEINHLLRVEPPHWFRQCLDGVSEEITSLAIAEKRYPFLSGITDCCRLIHRGEFSKNVAIDKYGEWLCVTGFNETLPAKQLLHKMRNLLDSLSHFCDCRGGVVKTNLRDPHKRKLFADIATWGKAIPDSFLVHEHDLHFRVQLNNRQHTGLFLDQCDSRRRIAKSAKGNRVANLFAFTCSFSVYALAAGAEVVFSVDLAAGCLKHGRENVTLNQLEKTGNAKFIKEDTRKWLARQIRKKKNDGLGFSPFDLIICDPPVFAAAGKGKCFHVEKEWPGLARDVHTILANDGEALFSNNHQAGSEAFYYNCLKEIFSEVTRLKPPLDFPQVMGQALHVRIYWCRK